MLTLFAVYARLFLVNDSEHYVVTISWHWSNRAIQMKISLSAAFSKPIEYQGTDAKNRFSSQSEKHS